MPSRAAVRAAGLGLGLLADRVVPDPGRCHPVALFGSLAAAAERRVRARTRLSGLVYAFAVAGGATWLGWALDRATRRHAPPAVAVTAVCTWAVLGQASLGREAAGLRARLEAGDLPGARARLPHLCGRDPSALDESGLARAAVESVAENTADALVAPLLWGIGCGPAGLLGYRAVNTLDAMVGYRSGRYARFGWAAARLDDGVTWLPARMTALATAAAAPLVGGTAATAWRVLRRDSSRHPSPNAGPCEAAMAGALGVHLGGVNHYPDGGGAAHRAEHRPEIGDGRPAGSGDIDRAVAVSRAVRDAALLALVLTVWRWLR